jgi:CRP-like cAMP-binding protein
MKLRCLGEGQTLVRRGDKAERIFYLLDGQVELPELGKVVRPGTVLGEIGVFGPDQKRTETMVCRTDCRFYELTGNQAMQLCFQDRKFGLVMLKLVIDRLIENNRRMLDAAAREPAEECRRAGP